jgi:hypothetical protein
MSLYFLVINLDKNVDRYDVISKSLTESGCNFERVRAINGYDMSNDEDAKKLLFPRNHLIGRLFKSIDTKRAWIYDGSIEKSFPNLNLYSHYGTKGLTMSNIKCFEIACNLNYDWFCILEDDSVIDEDTLNKISGFVGNPENNKYDIVLLDDRHYGWGGTSAMLYNKRVVNTLKHHLHPLSQFSITSDKYGDKNLGNVWDWKLWKYVNFINKKFALLPCVKSGNFPSTISEN